MRKPGVSRGTRNMVMPCLSGTVGSVRASMKKSLPTGALAMNAFSPLRIHSSPLRSARSFSPVLGSSPGRRLSEPALGSVMPLPSTKVSSATKAGRKRCFCSSVQAEEIRWLHFQFWLKAFEMALSALAAPFLRHRHGAEAELGALLDDVPVPGLARGRNGVARQRERADLFVGEFARRHLPGALFVAQGEVHGSILT